MFIDLLSWEFLLFSAFAIVLVASSTGPVRTVGFLGANFAFIFALLGPIGLASTLLFSGLGWGLTRVHLTASRWAAILSATLLILVFIYMLDYVVLGLGPRFITNLPPERPFKTIVDTYSPWSVTTGSNGVELHKKSLFGAARAKIRFIGKQPERFRSALRAWAAYWGRSFEEWPLGGSLLRQTGLLNLWQSQVERQVRLVSPYKFARGAGLSEADLAVYMSGGWWESVFDWDAHENSGAAAERLRQLMELLDAHDIGVAVVNMPERSYSRDRFTFEYDDYLGAIHDGIGPAPFLDLSVFAHDSEFFDAEHTIPEGSQRLTAHVTAWIQSLLN